jgi:uncharacterized protein YcfJ
MKTCALFLGLAVLAAVPASQAQVFCPETVRGAVAGGIIGAVVGHNDGRRGWEGAAYGVAAGALIGSFIGESRERHLPPVPRYHTGYLRTQAGPLWQRRQGWAHERQEDRWIRRPYRGPVGVYRYYGDNHHRFRSDRATRGLLIGGALGAIIGQNDGRRGWEGAAYGAGAGWILGALADQARARREEEHRARIEAGWDTVRRESPAVVQTPVVHHHHYYGAGRTMEGANRLFGR